MEGKFWPCSVCTFDNPPSNISCSICGAEIPHGKAKDATPIIKTLIECKFWAADPKGCRNGSKCAYAHSARHPGGIATIDGGAGGVGGVSNSSKDLLERLEPAEGAGAASKPVPPRAAGDLSKETEIALLHSEVDALRITAVSTEVGAVREFNPMGSYSWFKELFGFVEIDKSGEDPFEDTRSHFTFSLEKMTLTSKPNGRQFYFGRFSTPSIEELREFFPAGSSSGAVGGLTYKHIGADIRKLIQSTDNAGAVFQVASQFNCLEMVGPGITPEKGITIYSSDATQGPVCALCCVGGTLFRNYFVNGAGQRHSHQLNMLSDVEVSLDNEKNLYWSVVNGYCMPRTRSTLAVLNKRFSADPSLLDAVRAKLRLGVHWDVQVTGAAFNICQVFCSACPVSYTDTPSADWEPMARAVLDGTYEGTLAVAASLARERGVRVKVFLTAIGGGVFGNKLHWIADSIKRAMLIHSKASIDVYQVHYMRVNRENAIGSIKEL